MVSGRDYLGPYRLIRLIRSGNSSQVWEAVNDTTHQRIALKVLLPEQLKNKVAVEHLRHEAEVGKSLSHENIIEIYEFSSAHELPFVAMELFNAKNLKQASREEADSVGYHAEAIIIGAALGLQHVHEQGWIHCDIKPDNFLVKADQVKVIDFSIAQKQKKGGLAGIFGGRKQVQGTRSYMSPEQIRGKNLQPTSDIYSFGCLLFELFAGRPPFSGDSPNDLLNRHLKSPPPSLMAASTRVSQDFSDLVIRMMSKQPDDRPSSMSKFLTLFKSTRCYRAGMRPAAPQAETETGSASEDI